MRLFIAVELAPVVAEAAGVMLDELKGRAAQLAPRARITWVTADRLHLTVRFIGDADDARTHAICTTLEPAVDVPPFDLTVGGTGAFPTIGQPRVIWAGLTEGRDRLLQVERHVTARLRAADIAPEPRGYNPHLTLARVREAAGLRASTLFDGLAEKVIGTTTVAAITLFESRLSSKGPTYEPLVRTLLRGHITGPEGAEGQTPSHGTTHGV